MMTLKTPLFFFSVLLLTGCGSREEKHSDSLTEKEVRDFVAGYDRAWNSKDTVTMNVLMNNQYIYFSSRGDTHRKAPTIDFLGDTAYVIHKATRSEIEVIIAGDMATVSSRWIGDLTWNGESIYDNQRCGLTLRKADGVITVVAEHCVAITSG